MFSWHLLFLDGRNFIVPHTITPSKPLNAADDSSAGYPLPGVVIMGYFWKEAAAALGCSDFAKLHRLAA